ncbi:MAG TPA: penicillin-binding transpeptidase domain-containing protein [Nocardioides sp.]|uniref:penicillin-binding transpeptidase domain-containing protein n=1 Tax=Nocardioides sp. TaxID=35761 RepID=UPI002CE08078|nr:penicillin-binding transpeptidase domain-containing protein [Nocardioides sp.]HQR26034.1 penicillin-binding transpeptidase domain-containing protein [Nocardioides sp.]
MRPALATVRRVGARLAAATVVLGLLTGCQLVGGDGPPDPASTAGALVQGLASGEVSQVAWAEPAAEQYAAVVDGMGEVLPTVTLAGVEEQDATDTRPASATATLAWSWPLPGGEWTYRTEAALELAGDDWQVVWDPSLVEPSLAEDEVLDTTPIAPHRGDLLGAGGVPLVTDRPVVRFGIDRTQVPPARAGESARALARLLGLDVPAYVARVEAAGDKAFVEALVVRRGQVPSRVATGVAAIRGARALDGEAALAPTKDFAVPILGRVGQVTAEMIEEDPERYRLGDVAGLSGLQARYDDQLRGSPGVVVDALAPDGTERELFRADATAGTPLRTTLDPGLQLRAERLLADVRPASALVALRPSTGALLVAANGPGNGGVNLATYGQAAPGSTFKTVSVLALLRAGLRPDSPVPCTRSVVVDGKVFGNYSDYPSGGLGGIPLRSALANSCNTAFVSQADRLRPGDLAAAAASLGMGIDHDLGFPAYFGQVPRGAGSATEVAADMIGQGAVLASPLVMATAVASVQAGCTVVPHLLVGTDEEVPAAAAPLQASEVAQLRSMLRGVVTAGTAAQLADVPGPPVLAKTGTAEFDQGGRRLTHAWMIAAQGDLAVAVYVDVGESGSGTAGPLLEAFLRSAR